jgi:hypothetical protein
MRVILKGLASERYIILPIYGWPESELRNSASLINPLIGASPPPLSAAVDSENSAPRLF